MGWNDKVYNRHLKAKNEAMNRSFITNEGYEVKIIDYKDRHTVTIEIQDEYKYKTVTTMQNIRKGQIKNPYKRTVYDVGYYGVGRYKARVNNKKTLHYIKWFSMFNRCYNPKYHERQPRYKDCIVDERFRNFQDFSKWMDENWYEYDEMLELDKDLLLEGNKIYSPDKCCFIPKEINIALNNRRKDKEYMQKLYDKYKNILPKNIVEALYKTIK